ncbi:MAG TPA: hypothetical protein PKD64_04530 [Pirellulaceae bacterium]|nr:hypothetical protein [Pirellulaceae bacterium]HMO91439.1 hypothetical protein [Pirellulaceae bacterium]HMP69484.1 hypothetical protein [Pirellulaceae bacterium]
MSLNQTEIIEIVVQRVLDRLRQSAIPDSDSFVRHGELGFKEVPTVVGPPTVQSRRISKRVFSASDIDEACHEYVVDPGTIITPLAHEELHRRNVRISRVNSLPDSAYGDQTAKTTILHDHQQIAVEVQVDEVVRLLSARSGKPADYDFAPICLLTHRPHLLSCALNRVVAVRACIIDSLACYQSAVSQMNPNVVVIDAMRHPGRCDQLINAIWHHVTTRRGL